MVCMPDSRMAKQVLYGQRTEGAMKVGGVKIIFQYHIKQTMKKFNLDPGNLEASAANRDQWRGVIQGLVFDFENQGTVDRVLKCVRRHNEHPPALKSNNPHPHNL